MRRSRFLARLLTLGMLSLPLLHCSEEISVDPGPPHPGVAPAGRGTVDDPYEIATLDNLLWLSGDTAAWRGSVFVQTADIDASPTRHWNQGKGFSPIGSCSEYGFETAFRGTYHGKGHAIRGMTIARPGEAMVAFFGCLSIRARIDSVVLVDASVQGGGNCGALAGKSAGQIRNSSASGAVRCPINGGMLVGKNAGVSPRDTAVQIVGCRASGHVAGTREIGGLVGNNWGGAIRFCQASVDVAATEWHAGGLVGDNSGEIVSSRATGSVAGRDFTGGLVGSNSTSGAGIRQSGSTGGVTGRMDVGGLVGANRGAILQCAAFGNVIGAGDTGKYYPQPSLGVGGLVGYNDGMVDRSYARGSVTGDSAVGGLVGAGELISSIVGSYAIGRVVGRIDVGGLVGSMRPWQSPAHAVRVVSSHWVIEATGQADPYGTSADNLPPATGLTTAQAKTRAAYAGWDFDSAWAVEEGVDYPWLRALGRP